MRRSISQAKLKELLHYDPKTGVFTRIKGVKGYSSGSKVGSPHGNGYLRITVGGVSIYAHRLAWLYVYGNNPEYIDHKNRDKTDNRIDNLRIANKSENGANAKTQSRNKTGYKGVRWHSGRYAAYISKGGKYAHLGRFDTAEEAYQRYLTEANAIWGAYARVG